MDLLIIIIIIAIIISKTSKKKAKQNPSTVKEVNRNTKNLRKEQEKQQSAAKQQELKNRLEGKYGKVAKNTGSYGSSQTKKPSQTETSILERAKEHVQEDAADELKMQDAMLHEAAGGKAHTESSDNPEMDANALMDKVYDLMITGYSGNLQFDRDFLAEATDMLNRIQN